MYVVLRVRQARLCYLCKQIFQFMCFIYVSFILCKTSAAERGGCLSETKQRAELFSKM